MSEHEYGDVVRHPHPSVETAYTFIAGPGDWGHHAFAILQMMTGATGGSLDFGEGWGWWLRGEWSLPDSDTLDVVEESDDFTIVLHPDQAEVDDLVSAILDDILGEQDE